MLTELRRAAIMELLGTSGAVTVTDLETRFDVSSETTRRDLAELERRGLLRRTHGGAVLPETKGTEPLAPEENSFARRLARSTEAKHRLADAAVDLLEPSQTVFLDSSTTSYFVAQRILEVRMNLTVLTNSQPIMQLVFSAAKPSIALIAMGGILRPLTGSFVGPVATATVQAHFADRLFLSVKGVTQAGLLTEADTLEAEVKRMMIAHADRATLLIDRSKLSRRGLGAVAPVSSLSGVIADGISHRELEQLRAPHVSLRVVSAPSR